MKVSEVSQEDMKSCADLMQFVKGAEVLIKMSNAELLFKAVTWLQSLGKQMILSNTTPPAEKEASLSGVKIHKAKS